MTRSDHSATPAPVGRTDSTRPRRTGRDEDRRPYPSAPARTATSRRGTCRAGTPTRSHTAFTAPTPATVWACGPTPIDPDTPWPTALLTKIVTSFSEPGDRVVVLPRPTAAPRPPHRPGRAQGLIDHATTVDPDDELATALTAITDLARRARVVRLEPDLTAGGRASRPFWADLVGTPDNTPAHEPAALPGWPPDAAPNRFDVASADADLIITSLRPEPSTDRASDHVALLAARLLRVGGILAVLTHSDWSRGELVDPTGPVVASAQNADLLYLQHIIALHTPIHGGQFVGHLHGAEAPTHHRAHGYRLPAPQNLLRRPGVRPTTRSPTATARTGRRRGRDRTHPMTPTSRHHPGNPCKEGTPVADENIHHDPSQTNLDGPRVRNPRAVIDHPDPATPDAVSTVAAVSVWATAQTSPAAQRKSRYVAESTAHPAKMLPAVAAHAITHYTQPGDLVLDPMCGIGTTLIEALHQDRRALGVEYEPHWVHVTRANLDLARQNGIEHHGRVFHGDARQLATLLPEEYLGQAALVVTSPPYGPSTHGQVTAAPGGGVHKYHHLYGNALDRGNLANIGHHRLLTGFTKILTATAAFLRPGGHIAITIRPWREHAELIDLPSQILACGTHAGLIPVERCVALLARLADDDLITRGSFFQRDFIRKQRQAGLPLHLIAHEDVLVFRKKRKPASSASAILTDSRRSRPTARAGQAIPVNLRVDAITPRSRAA